MDLIKIELAKLNRGHVTTMYGIVVMRIGNNFNFGETINVRAKGVGIVEASRGIYDLCRTDPRETRYFERTENR